MGTFLRRSEEHGSMIIGIDGIYDRTRPTLAQRLAVWWSAAEGIPEVRVSGRIFVREVTE
jgi:hypothetical protein